MGEIEDIYADLDADVSEVEFREAVAEKVDQMGGLADEETAAMLIAHELSDREVGAIADIEPGMEEVKFLGKVISVGEIREFERDDSDEPGSVVNLELADESGSIRAAFWDEMAHSVVDELSEGIILRVKGRPREGYEGVEVSVDKAEPDPDAELDVDLSGERTIEDLSMGLSDVSVRGQLLDVDESVRMFDRDDGTEGRVANMVLGDETGRIRVTLWDGATEYIESLGAGESIEVIDGYVRERDGDLELHVGERGKIESLDEDVKYVSETTDIAEVELDTTVDIGGVVRSADPIRTFDRDDGTEGQVRNIRVQDDTGDIRVALWGEKADLDLGPGDEVQLTDIEIQDGWQDDREASANWNSTVTLLEEGTTSVNDTGDENRSESDGRANDDVGLGAFSGDDGNTDVESDTTDSGDLDGEHVEFTGVVVQVGDPVVLDDGDETVSVETDADLELGQEVTVSGPRTDGRIDASQVE